MTARRLGWHLACLAFLAVLLYPVVWLAARPGFDLTVIWYLSLVAVVVHAAANWLLVQRQIRLAETAAAAVVP